MNHDYQEIISKAGEQISEKFLEKEDNIAARAVFLDADIAEITRQIGLETTKIIIRNASDRLVKKKQTEGLTIQREPAIRFNVIFGQIEISSPYLWDKGRGSKPLTDEMGITHQGRSEAVNRALSDFGIEESFAQAAERFKEHYKYDLSSSTVSRVTKQTAEEALEYVSSKLAEADKIYENIKDNGETAEQMLIELDGCEIRTAVLQPAENSEETTPVHNNPKKEKIINWRDVRMGLARPLDSVSKIYVGKKSSYPEVVRDLFNASVLIGMSPETEAVGVADGGIGLMEELKSQFPNMQFILDKTHLKDHLYDTAEKLGICRKDRPGWVKPRLEAVSRGDVGNVKKELEDEYGRNPNERLRRLIGYINRFYDALDYNNFKARGYPVGSGEIESAHKSIPQKRLKLPGACWHPDSVNPVLALRILRADDWWEDFWKERTKRMLEEKIAA